jgi:hypothetical protein
VNADDNNAKINISWEPTNLSAEDFLGYELSVVEGGERIITDLIMNSETTEYDYPYPISGTAYPIAVRQIEDLDGSPVPGKWNGDSVTSDYYPFFFVKDLADPSILVKWEPNTDTVPEFQHETGLEATEMMFLDTPVHFLDNLENESTSVDMYIWDDPYIAQNKGELLNNARIMGQISKRVCLLSHLPEKKTFCVVGGFSYKVNQIHDYESNMELKTTSWDEDFYRRGGSVIGFLY